jgi:hypothetical protein
MQGTFGGLLSGAILLVMASDARAQDYGVYQMYAPMTWGSSSVPMDYSLTSRYQGYAAPYAYGPQNNAYSNVGLGSFVNGDDYRPGVSPLSINGGYSEGWVNRANAPARMPARVRLLGRLGGRRR